eukprot:gene14624-5707_t
MLPSHGDETSDHQEAENDHNHAFIDDLWNRLSPIKNGSPTLQCERKASVASTPLLPSQRPSRLVRSVKRRRHSRFPEQRPKQQKKLEEDIPVISSYSSAAINEERQMMEVSNIGESLNEALTGEITIIPNSMPNSPEKIIMKSGAKTTENIIEVTDSLHVTTDMHSKLTTSFDNMIMSGECNLENDSNLGKHKKCETFYGLPLKVKDILKLQRGIENVYEWQNDCLSLPALNMRKNLIYSLPTSGGKTLVAEILILKELLVREKNAILVLPYVSIVQEKVRGLSPFAVELGFHVEEYAASKGSFPPKKRRKRQSVYIATIEKADGIVNSLIEDDRLDELGMVVVDELHMIGEGGSRGARLETCLTKLIYSKADAQIIGMSATLGNLCDLEKFLDAEIYCNDFRPVKLTEHVKFGDTVYEIDNAKLQTNVEEAFKPVRKLTHPKELSKKIGSVDPDHISTLALEVIPNHSCLIFCATKKNCENVAAMLVKCLPDTLKETKKEQRLQLLKTIRDSVNNVCEVLRRTIPYGISYHHSGLTMDERKLIEDAYSLGTLCLLCCTSTLAAGVNLPAKRVILRAPYIGNSFLTKSRYNQMIGRAGRAGIDSSGESILVVHAKDKSKMMDLLKGNIDRCYSSLDYEESKGLRAFILSSIGLKLCSTVPELKSLMEKTLFYVQGCKESDFDIEQRINTEIEKLSAVGLVRLKEQSQNGSLTKVLEATELGRATYKGSLDVDSTQFIYQELLKGTKNLVLTHELHLLYLVTPLESVKDIRLNWMPYYQHFSKLSPDEIQAAELIGVSESFITRKAAGQRCAKDNVNEFVLRRFWLTLMIYQLVKEVSVWQVAANFGSTRGFLQGLLTSTASFASMLINFTKELPEFWSLRLLFEAMLQRLSYAATAELIPLMEIPGVKLARAKQLYKAGYHTLKSLAWANAEDLCRNIDYLPKKQANLIVSTAKMLLQEKAESLRDEVEEMMQQSQ